MRTRLNITLHVPLLTQIIHGLMLDIELVAKLWRWTTLQPPQRYDWLNSVHGSYLCFPLHTYFPFAIHPASIRVSCQPLISHSLWALSYPSNKTSLVNLFFYLLMRQRSHENTPTMCEGRDVEREGIAPTFKGLCCRGQKKIIIIIIIIKTWVVKHIKRKELRYFTS